MPQTYAVQYEITEEVADNAADVFVGNMQKQLNTKFPKALKALGPFVILMGLFCYLSLDFQIDWRVRIIPFVLLSLIGGLLLFLVILYFILGMTPFVRWKTRRAIMRPFRDLGDRTIRWTFGEEHFEVHMATRHREIPWNTVMFLTITHGFWIFQMTNKLALFVPEAVLSTAIQQMIRRKLDEVAVAARAQVKSSVH